MKMLRYDTDCHADSLIYRCDGGVYLVHSRHFGIHDELYYAFPDSVEDSPLAQFIRLLDPEELVK